MSLDNCSQTHESPFGGAASAVQNISLSALRMKYLKKCGLDVSPHLEAVSKDALTLYRCQRTGYLFWRPAAIAGDENFYRQMSSAWPNYYRPTRWEYPIAREIVSRRSSVLEVGCGPGHFLRRIEGVVDNALGLELNREAAAEKVTCFPILHAELKTLVSEGRTFGAICAFHTLEHLLDPSTFIEHCLALLEHDGVLLLTVPNNDFIDFKSQSDAFDLPPHHVGHFNPDVFLRVAQLYRLDIQRMVIQRREACLPDVTAATAASPLYTVARIVAKTAINAAWRILREPGPTLLVSMRKS